MDHRYETLAASPADAGRKLSKLRDFSVQLSARLQSADGPLTAPARLAVRVGAAAYLLEMTRIGEIVALPAVTPVPWTKPWFRGLTNVRGRLVGVVDLGHLGGLAPLAEDEAQQLVVFSDAAKLNAALVITRAYGLRNAHELEALGPVQERHRPWETRAFRDADGSRLVEVDLQQLMALPELANIGA